MTNTILVTVSITGTISSKEVDVRQLLEKKDVNFLKSGVFSKVTLTFEETTESKKPITLRKFADAYTEEELR
jgi:hypothetical protein